MQLVTRPDDPSRCQASAGSNQCNAVALEGEKFCAQHSGSRVTKTPAKLRQYHLLNTYLKDSYEKFSENENIKTLRDEVSLARALLERRLNLITCDADVLANSGAVNQQFLVLQKLVTSMHTLDKSLNNLVSREDLIACANALYSVVAEELEGIEDYELITDRIGNRMAEALRRPTFTAVEAIEDNS